MALIKKQTGLPRKEFIFEIATWGFFVVATLFVVLYFPYSVAYSALFYVLIAATFASTFWYLRSRRLYILAMQNADEARSSNQELVKQRQTSEIVFDHSSDGILIVDDSKRIIDFSVGLEKMTAYKKEELLGKIADSQLAFSGDRQNPPILSIILLPKDHGADRKTSRILSNALKIKNGKFIQVEINYDNFKDPVSGHLIGMAVLRDITYEKEVRERDREFVSMASHQIFTPLSMIRGYVSLILGQKAGKLNPKQLQYAEQAYQSSRSLVALIMSLLSASRIEGEKINLRPSSLNLVHLIEKIIKDFKTGNQLNGNSLKFASKDKTIMIEADSEKLSQAISNCLDNAIKYTDNGAVTVHLERMKDQAILRIVDNGIGIPENEIERVGTKFYRGSNALNRDTQGTGLGMFVSVYIIEEHQGRLEIKSKINQGTTVTIRLPLSANKETYEKDSHN